MSEEIYENNVKLPSCQLIWPFLFKPDTSKFGKNKFSVSCLWYPGTTLDDMKPYLKICLKLLNERFGATSLKGYKLPFRKGDLMASKYPFMAGRLFMKTRTKDKPMVVGPNPKVAISEEQCYSGMRGRLLGSFGTFESSERVRDAQTGEIVTETVRGVSFFPNVVQKLGDDDRIGGNTDVSALDDEESLAALNDGSDDPASYGESGAPAAGALDLDAGLALGLDDDSDPIGDL